MRNKTTEATEGHREEVFGIIEYIHEEVAFVQVNYARLPSILISFPSIIVHHHTEFRASRRLTDHAQQHII